MFFYGAGELIPGGGGHGPPEESFHFRSRSCFFPRLARGLFLIPGGFPMDKFVIEGGKPLTGEITVSGAKNACLPLMTATLLSDEPSTLENAPHLRDVDWMKYLLEHLGARVEFERNVMRVDPGGFDTDFVPYDIMRKMRASMYAMGPMIARFGRARISLPGGCAIGERPVDVHLRGFEALGCKIALRHGYVHAAHNGLRGATVSMAGERGPSVGATCNIMMAAALAEGETVLTGAACEPEVVQLGEMLQMMGAEVHGLGNRVIRIRGQKKLKGVRIRVIPDRIEAATFLFAGAITRGDLVVNNAPPEHLHAVTDVLLRIGARVEYEGDCRFRVRGAERYRGAQIRTEVFPGFPTDCQAPLSALLTLCEGDSVIEETIYTERFKHIPELRRLGAKVRQEGASLCVSGVERLSGAPVMASDLRCGAALILAGLAAENTTEVLRVYHVDRGYEQIEKKLKKAGAVIQRTAMTEQTEENLMDSPPEFPAEFGFLPRAAKPGAGIQPTAGM